MSVTFKSCLLRGLPAACAFLLALLTTIGVQISVFAAVAKTVQELTLVIRKPNVGSKARSVEVTSVGPNVTVVAEEGPTATDNDLKIDAVFLTHALVSDVPDQVDSVKVVFLQTGKDSRSVTVDKSRIKEYEKGAISGKDLVATLELKLEALRQERVLEPGPELDRRTQINKRIEKLRVQQVGVRPFENALNDIESLVKQQSPDIDRRISILEGQLAAQEETLRRRPKANAALVKAGSGSTGAPGSGAGVAFTPVMSAAGYIPPEGPHLKAVFQRDADNLIRSVQQKNPTIAAQLRDIKKSIDAAFASGKEPEAFQCLRQFQILVQQVTNLDMFMPGGQGGGQSGGPTGGGPTGGGPTGGGPTGGGPTGGGPPSGGPPGGGPPGGGPPGGGPPLP